MSRNYHDICANEPMCSHCGQRCNIIKLDNSFDYPGTHCTSGKSGTFYPDDYGTPVSDCCEAKVIQAEDY